MHARQATVALADRRPHRLDDYGFSHGNFSLNVGLFPERRGTRFTRSTYWLVDHIRSHAIASAQEP